MSTISLPHPTSSMTAQATVVRFALGIALSAISGLLFLLAFPPYGLWPLAWFGLVPAMLAQYRLLPAKWSSLGPAIFAAFWLGPFLARLFGPDYGPFFQYLGFWIAILNFFVSKDRNFHELTHYRWFILQGMASWVGFEIIRALFIPIIATSAFIGYTQATQAWLIQPALSFQHLWAEPGDDIVQLCPGARRDGSTRPEMEGSRCHRSGRTFRPALDVGHGGCARGMDWPQPAPPEHHARHA